MSSPKRPRIDDDADNEPKDSKQILVYRNGDSREWKVFKVSTSLEALLEEIGVKFGRQAKRLFTSKGAEIRSADELRQVLPSTLVPSLPPDDSEWVLLNVGGQYFATTRTTLTSSEPRSKLAGLFSVRPNAANFAARRDAQGAYMFDREPAYFRVLLNYLRYKKVMLDKDVSATGVLEEAKYFGIEGLVKELGDVSEVNELTVRAVLVTRCKVFVLEHAIFIRQRYVTGLRRNTADFTGADLSHLDLNHINFKFAKMEKCDLSHCILNHSCFERADLREAKLEKAQLLGAKFNHANLSGAYAKSCILGQQGDVAVDIANMEGANLNDAVLDGSKMYGVNLKKAELNKVSLVGCDMRTAILAGATLMDCNLQHCDMKDVVLG
ncbi:hypothetical protein HPB52_018679 [Rhipicephalus sanguineus]|uniref:BTB domain-containing protein n=1 Tax=Rhipicephalus sanguineus TaxID=34632 RepID=A0A9D4SRU9_RHISA|nr:hypothetical protein HPB52_018679 [Rhipicephalus sanguineus]